MEWPPQNSGLFEVPECIRCCVPTVVCEYSFLDDPFLQALYTQTARTEFPGTTCVDSNQTTFTRFAANIVAGEFGFDRYWINDAFSYDPSAPECDLVTALGFSMSCRIQAITGTLDPTVHFDAMIKQGGNFFICNHPGRRWSLTSVQASFQAKTGSTLTSDGWERFNVADASPTIAAVPDFTATGGPIQFGFRASYGSLNFEGVDRTITFDVEKFGVSLT